MTITVTGFPATDPIPAIRLNVLLGQGTRSPGTGARAVCMIGPRSYTSNFATPEGTATAGVIYQVYSADEAAGYWGYGSTLHRMAIKLFGAWSGVTLYGVGFGKGTTATRGTSSTVLAGAPAAGTISLYIGDDDVEEIAVTGADAVDDVGTRIASQATARTTFPVWTAYDNGTNTLTFTAKCPGSDTNGIKWHIDAGASGVTFDGAATDAATLSAGTEGDLPWTTSYDAIQASDVRFYYILPATHTSGVITTTGNVRDLIEDCATADVGKRMCAVVGQCEADTTATTLADTLDEETVAADEPSFRFQIVWASYNECQPWEVAAAVLGHRAEAETSNVNENWIGFQGKVIAGVHPALSNANFPTTAQITSCLNGGVSPLQYDSVGDTATLVRSISAKHLTAGADDYRARDTNIIAVSDYVAYGLIDSLTDEFSGFTVTDDDADGVPPDNLASHETTPKLIEKTIYRLLKNDYEDPGLICNVDDHLDELVCERNASNSQRVDAEIPIEVARWLLQIGGNVREVGAE